MALKLGTKTIGNACLGDKQLSAVFLGDKLIWSAGVKLQSLLGKQNASGSFTQSNLNLYPRKDGSFGRAFDVNSKTIERKANHKYFLCVNIKIDATGERLLGLWDTSSSGYGADNRSSASVSGDCNYCIISPTTTIDASVPTFQFLSMTYAEVKSAFILDLTASKLDQFSATQIYNLLTLNGTDFTNLEKLADGYAVKCGEFKIETKRTIDLSSLTWAYDGTNFKGTAINGIYAGLDAKPDMSIDGYETETTRELAYTHSKDKVASIYPANTVLIRDTRYSDTTSFIQAISGVKITYAVDMPTEIKGTKYGIISLDFLASADVGYQADHNRFIFFKKNFGDKFVSATDQIANAYTEGYDTVAYNSIGNADKQIGQYTSGYWYMTDFAFNGDINAFKASLNGKYLIYELATPLGSKLDNYTAEQTYNLLIGTGKTETVTGSKYGIVNLGSLNWNYYKTDAMTIGCMRATLPNMMPRAIQSEVSNMFCSKYTTYKNYYVGNSAVSQVDKICWLSVGSGNIFAINDSSFTSPDEFKASLNGVYLVYELADVVGTKFKDLNAKQVYELVAKPKAVYPNGLKFEMKTTKTVNLDQLNYGIAGHDMTAGYVRVSVSSLSDAKVGTNHISVSSSKLQAVDFAIGANTQNIGRISLSTYSYYLYICLSTSEIGWDGQASTIQQCVTNYLAGVELTYELASPTAVKGTKYGLVDLGTLSWSYTGGTLNKFYTYSIKDIIKKIGGGEIANIYCYQYKADTLNKTWGNSPVDKSICVSSDGFLGIYDSSLTNVPDQLKGMYAVFELATPDGTDYADLTAKQMFDLINTDKLGVLAEGKSFDGNRSLLGVQNVETTLDPSSYSWLPYIFPTNNNSFRLENNAQETNQKKRHFIANHKYFICVSIKDGSISVGNGWFNVENGNIFNDIKQNGNDYFAVANCGYTGDGFMVLRANNTMPITPQSCVIIDLTELGLDSLTAQQVYHHFKEYNLKKLKTDNIIKIGGFVK